MRKNAITALAVAMMISVTPTAYATGKNDFTGINNKDDFIFMGDMGNYSMYIQKGSAVIGEALSYADVLALFAQEEGNSRISGLFQTVTVFCDRKQPEVQLVVQGFRGPEGTWNVRTRAEAYADADPPQVYPKGTVYGDLAKTLCRK